MELRVLRYFLAVAEAGSVTAAARQVHVTQPSLSRQLSGLEKELGVVLFTRRPGSLTLNAAGHRFRPVARDLVRRAEQAAETMAAVGRGEGAALTVVASAPTVAYLLAPFMAEGGAAGPTLQDAIQEEPSRVFDTLLRSDADLGVSTSPAPAPLESAFLGRTPVIAQVPPDHPWSERATVTLAELVTEPLIVMPRSHVARLVVDEAVSRANLSPADIAESGSPAFAQALAARGRGVCLVTDDARFGLRELIVHTSDGPLTVPLYAGWDASHYARASIHALIDGLRTHIAHRVQRFPGHVDATAPSRSPAWPPPEAAPGRGGGEPRGAAGS
ncbi:LysR family transcriptional regulator [Streptomyces luomodiensis]|uniref:LysR family transcriptional regulator n=1 Tax=Streptomyces luomodiensis TaxID=3026192 RepID=A0ABY9V489_9ACTN|nr:LysR family transcriptional regulator [Streptomyces sp. SCA4-21]WNE99687.1 LysR family transcriptional regulator [Streptomyces sp. SCA4-21]